MGEIFNISNKDALKKKEPMPLINTNNLTVSK